MFALRSSLRKGEALQHAVLLLVGSRPTIRMRFSGVHAGIPLRENARGVVDFPENLIDVVYRRSRRHRQIAECRRRSPPSIGTAPDRGRVRRGYRQVLA